MSELRLVAGHNTFLPETKFGRFHFIYNEAVQQAYKEKFSIPSGWKLEEAQSAYLLSVWIRNKMQYIKTANELGIGRSTLYRKIREIGVTDKIAAELFQLAQEVKSSV